MEVLIRKTHTEHITLQMIYLPQDYQHAMCHGSTVDKYVKTKTGLFRQGHNRP